MAIFAHGFTHESPANIFNFRENQALKHFPSLLP